MAVLSVSDEEQRRILLESQALREPSPILREAADADVAASLYSMLISPVSEHLRHQHLIVVPQGWLHHVPFAALRNPATDRFLAEDFVLSLAPSASALASLLRPAQKGSREVLVLGDPATDLEPLREARQEAQRVAGLFGVSPHLGEYAIEAMVHARSRQLGLLHLAAHGQNDSKAPILSRIALGAGEGHDGVLELHEIWDRLDLPVARLVTLSSCETALGQLTRGDEVIGLTQAFLVAGSQAVLSALRPVDDEASAELMAAFYRRLLGGAGAAAALRDAQRELLRDPRFSAPYFWAGFTLTGNPQTQWLS